MDKFLHCSVKLTVKFSELQIEMKDSTHHIRILGILKDHMCRACGKDSTGVSIVTAT